LGHFRQRDFGTREANGGYRLCKNTEKAFIFNEQADQATLHFEDRTPSTGFGNIPKTPQNTALLH
jgi:hypothetical protein